MANSLAKPSSYCFIIVVLPARQALSPFTFHRNQELRLRLRLHYEPRHSTRMLLSPVPTQPFMMVPKRLWNVLAAGACLSIILYFSWSHTRLLVIDSSKSTSDEPTLDKPTERPPGPIYKNLSSTSTIKRPPIKDNFPFAESLRKGDLPDIPSWNRPPTPHVPEKTPLFIGFTRSWPLLQQCVLSYITSGWPPEDIYVVDNTGTMKSNFPPQKLTLQNPHYLNVQRLTDLFGVNVISTPTLLSFAQLQNFYIFTALEKGWDYFWWSHSRYICFIPMASRVSKTIYIGF